MIDALAHVNREMPDAQLWLVGPDAGLVIADGRKWKIEQFIRNRLRGLRDEGRSCLLARLPSVAGT